MDDTALQTESRGVSSPVTSLHYCRNGRNRLMGFNFKQVLLLLSLFLLVGGCIYLFSKHLFVTSMPGKEGRQHLPLS